jgi:hypothetical protein
LLISTAAILLPSRARKRNLSPWPLVTHCTYGCQNSHIRQLVNDTFQLFNSYKRGSVFRAPTGSITPFHLCLHSSIKKKKFHWVTGGQDSISRNSLFETFLMMCRSTSDLSLLVSMQFFPNYRITLTAHIASLSFIPTTLLHVCVLLLSGSLYTYRLNYFNVTTEK